MDAGLVTLSGRAWSGHGLVERVEVAVDRRWADATLAAPAGEFAWRGWSFEWDATTGEHELACRATDAAGNVQPLAPPWNCQAWAATSSSASLSPSVEARQLAPFRRRGARRRSSLAGIDLWAGIDRCQPGSSAVRMSSCCHPRGCDSFFGERFARRAAKRYRRRGLDKTARRIVDFLAARGIEGASVLEVGGGVGGLQIELLKRGANRTINLELSPAYEGEARALLTEAGLADRVERRLHDIAVGADGVEPADAVVLHRVVCCYPDYERLLGAAAGRARRLLVFSYPRRNAVARLLVGAENLAFRVMRKEFRTFAHPPDAMLAVVRAHGLDTKFTHAGVMWHVAGLTR